MTGPIPKVTCPICGGEYARRLDGTPYAHTCHDGQSPPSVAKRRRCGRCGLFLSSVPTVHCPKCQTVWAALSARTH